MEKSLGPWGGQAKGALSSWQKKDMHQVRQPPVNPFLLQEAGKVHQGYHTSTTAGMLAALCFVAGHPECLRSPQGARMLRHFPHSPVPQTL